MRPAAQPADHKFLSWASRVQLVLRATVYIYTVYLYRSIKRSRPHTGIR